jgi:hypothetical protein
MAELRRKKLAYFQKTHNGVTKKTDMVVATNAKVNTPLTPEDLVHTVDVSVASKYGDDLTQFTRVVAEDMHNTIAVFKTDTNNILPR